MSAWDSATRSEETAIKFHMFYLLKSVHALKCRLKSDKNKTLHKKKTYRIAITDLSEAKDTVDDLNITTEHDEHLVVSEISTTIDCKYAAQICRNLIVG